jgi:hypothetical protein
LVSLWGCRQAIRQLAQVERLAFPLTPPELNAGTAYRFSIFHIMELDGDDELGALFPFACEDI